MGLQELGTMRKLFVLPIIFLAVMAFTSAATERNFSANLAAETSQGSNGGGQRWVQTFTLGQTGTGNNPMMITNISVAMNATYQGIINFTIQGVNASGSADGNVLAFGIWNTSATGVHSGFTNITFLNRTVLQGSTKYALVNEGGIATLITAQNQGYTGGNITIGQAVQPESVRFMVWGQNNTLFVRTGQAANLSGTPTINATLYGFTVVAFQNVTYFVWNSTGALVNVSTRLVAGSNVSTHTLAIANLVPFQTYTYNPLGCPASLALANCSFGGNFTFFTAFTDNNATYNATTYETAHETFVVNISVGSTSVSSASLWYNGTEYSGATVTQSGTDYIISQDIDIPASPGTKNWFFSLLFGSGVSANTTVRTQTVTAINFSICGAAPFTIPYANISFRNETALAQTINATISSTWIYYIGEGTVNKTYSFTNTTENQKYSFCFSPSSLGVTVLGTIAYANSESTQRIRTINGDTLTNTTTQYILYLLPSTLGIFTRYQTVNAAGGVISGVFAQVSKSIGGTPTIIASGFTDSSGLIAFFLNPDDTYDYSFSKSGFTTVSFSLIPNSLDTYVITMGGGTTGITNGTQISQNLSYVFLPSNLTLQNGTNYTFSFNVSSSRALTFSSFNITNSSGGQLGFTSGSGVGILSLNVNTGNDTFIYGYGTIGEGTERFTIVHLWQINKDFIGDYSIQRQLGLFSQYNFSAFTRILLFLVFLIGIMIYVSRNETIDTSESKMVIVLAIVWIASIFHFLDIGLTVTASGAIGSIAENASQYGIAILTSAAAMALILRRVFT